jgi:hypothetical protein
VVKQCQVAVRHAERVDGAAGIMRASPALPFDFTIVGLAAISIVGLVAISIVGLAAMKG